MVSEGFARCLAKITGDGNLSKTYLRYSNTCSELLEEFQRDMSAEFPGVHFTLGRVPSGTSFVQVHRKDILQCFGSHLESFRSTDVRIPDSVLQADIGVQGTYLRALFDDEGCVALRIFRKTGEWKRNITLTSNSYQLLEEVKVMLRSKFGIYSNKIIPNCAGSSRDRSYVLSITGRENFIRFNEHIGFAHPKKIRRLSELLRSYIRKRRTAIPGSHA